ncbi:Piso0_002065 [Millerozyma farinosa CBS 7064]|uniref:Mitochondrial thiamine pyrophosphate carrier 1 n=1 Tax=Pichia sorbitophila (strain ATCC MYA-4447 / BCRC 22081 / CBS 7064 / NBRC 10061 / NRRL Y-12695) TaxID=559304 RepID=G8YBL3_PICSO|nr:Piso0_002065 [Millerozyma farinosa CBS 7064]
MVQETKTETRQKSSAEKVSTLGGFIAGGLAACGAVTFTNPIELVKTRMQLQGELEKADKHATKLYRNPVQAFLHVYKHEGIRGLQKGLLCGYYYQIGLNGCRIGLYEPSRYYITKLVQPDIIQEGRPIPQNVSVNVLAGTISGAAGAVLASPFFLVKTRMQSYSGTQATHSSVPHVGQQTYYKNFWDGLTKIYSSEGVKGLFRGVDAAVLRTGAGSAAQLPIYNLIKHTLLDYKLVEESSTLLSFISSAMAGVGVSIVMNPWDVVLTRVYNQKGNLYKGPLDCFIKSVRIEGVAALYKGFWAQLFRVWPHSVLTLMFMEYCMEFMQKLESAF